MVNVSVICFSCLLLERNFSEHFGGKVPTINTIIVVDYSIQENPSLDVFPKATGHSFKKDYKLECIDPKHPSYICVCTIVKVKGARLRLHFDGWSESYDFWTNVDSPFIFPMHWCEKNGQVLHPPRSESFSDE